MCTVDINIFIGIFLSFIQIVFASFVIVAWLLSWLFFGIFRIFREAYQKFIFCIKFAYVRIILLQLIWNRESKVKEEGKKPQHNAHNVENAVNWEKVPIRYYVLCIIVYHFNSSTQTCCPKMLKSSRMLRLKIVKMCLIIINSILLFIYVYTMFWLCEVCSLKMNAKRKKSNVGIFEPSLITG